VDSTHSDLLTICKSFFRTFSEFVLRGASVGEGGNKSRVVYLTVGSQGLMLQSPELANRKQNSNKSKTYYFNELQSWRSGAAPGLADFGTDTVGTTTGGAAVVERLDGLLEVTSQMEASTPDTAAAATNPFEPEPE
jgi:hypothetical protein